MTADNIFILRNGHCNKAQRLTNFSKSQMYSFGTYLQKIAGGKGVQVIAGNKPSLLQCARRLTKTLGVPFEESPVLGQVGNDIDLPAALKLITSSDDRTVVLIVGDELSGALTHYFGKEILNCKSFPSIPPNNGSAWHFSPITASYSHASAQVT